MTVDTETKAKCDQLCKKMVDQGLLVEAGWQSLKILALPKDASQTQLSEMRMAFFAGAQHLFGSIMGILDPGQEPTERDMQRMSLISEELNRFIEEFKARGHA